MIKVFVDHKKKEIRGTISADCVKDGGEKHIELIAKRLDEYPSYSLSNAVLPIDGMNEEEIADLNKINTLFDEMLSSLNEIKKRINDDG